MHSRLDIPRTFVTLACIAAMPALASADPCDEHAPTSTVRSVDAAGRAPVALAVVRGTAGAEDDTPRSEIRASSLAVASATEDGHTYEVRVENGDVSATVDGKPVPPNRIRRTGNRIVILDANGKELKSFPMATEFGEEGVRVTISSAAADGDAPRSPRFPAAARRGNPGGGGGVMAWVPATPPPKVMLGIVMGEPDPALQHHLGVKPGEAVVLTQVMDGLSAARSGLETFDVVVAVDGQRPATDARIREALAGKQPGDAIVFEVIRGGKTKTVEVKLDAFDAGAMRSAAPDDAFAILEDFDFDDLAGSQRFMDADQLREMIEMLRDQAGAIAIAPGQRGLFVPPSPPAPPVAPVPPVMPRAGGGWIQAAPGGAAADVATEQRLERLEQRIDELGARIDRLLRQLERSAG